MIIPLWVCLRDSRHAASLHPLTPAPPRRTIAAGVARGGGKPMVKIETVEPDRKGIRGPEVAVGMVYEAESDTGSCGEWSGGTLAGRETLV